MGVSYEQARVGVSFAVLALSQKPVPRTPLVSAKGVGRSTNV